MRIYYYYVIKMKRVKFNISIISIFNLFVLFIVIFMIGFNKKFILVII